MQYPGLQGGWRAWRRIDTGHAGRLHSRERAQGHGQPCCRGGGNVGRGKGCRRRHRSGGGSPASRDADGRGLHSAAQRTSNLAGRWQPYGKINNHFDRRVDLSSSGALIHCSVSTDRHNPLLVADCAHPESQITEKMSQITWPGATLQILQSFHKKPSTQPRSIVPPICPSFRVNVASNQ